MFIVTLLTTTASAEDQARDAEALVAAAGVRPVERAWRDGAVDLLCEGTPAAARAALAELPADAFVLPWPRPDVRLLIADMDSTMITVECIDELADYAGVKAEVAEITERAMRGELDFEAALRTRVALLRGLPETVLARCHDERVRLTPGAVTLVRTLAAQGVRTLLVSGGFTAFADPVAAAIGFDGARANVLGIRDGVLDGTVAEPILGAAAKRTALREMVETLGIAPAQSVAIGDGANDIPMLEAAGLGVAYHAKPRAAAAADIAIRHGDLTAVLHALGIDRRDWHTG
jgi:phosphoserine phosphatase